MKKILILTVILICSASCGTSKNANQSEDFSEQVTEKYWKLVSLSGEEIKMATPQKREAYFIMKADGNALTGFSGCNNFSGKYELKGEGKIEFSSVIGTLKACQYLGYNESTFYKIFVKTQTYQIENDHLQLFSEEGETLAEFEAVHF